MAQREGERISPQLHRDGGGFGEGSNPSWRAAAGSVYPHQLRARPTQPRPPLSATGPATPAPGQSQPPSRCSRGRAVPEVTAPSGEEGCQHRESGGGLSCHWIPTCCPRTARSPKSKTLGPRPEAGRVAPALPPGAAGIWRPGTSSAPQQPLTLPQAAPHFPAPLGMEGRTSCWGLSSPQGPVPRSRQGDWDRTVPDPPN